MSRIPNYYRPMFPDGPAGPLRWQDDVTGILPSAMQAFFIGGPLRPEEFSLVREYGEYYINAPCWDWNPHLTEEGKEELAKLRQFIKTAGTRQELNTWIEMCLDRGIDPF